MIAWRAAGPIATAVGAAGSVALMVHAGRDAPPLLLLMMSCWVVSPFAALAAAEAISVRWAAMTRAALSRAALVVTLVTLAVYGIIAASPTRTQTPFFVMVPPASWGAIALYLFFSWKRAPRRMSGSA